MEALTGRLGPRPRTNAGRAGTHATRAGTHATRRVAAAWLGIGLLPVLAPGGCGSSSTAPDEAADVRIELSVSGGLASADWGYAIDGEAGVIRGGPCRDRIGCDWEPGEVLARIEEERVLALAREFVESGFPRFGRRDFGVQCCDQFAYVLSYADEGEGATVTGSDGTLPEEVLSLIDLVRGFVEEARGPRNAARRGASARF